jgi:peptidoglycan hydrolase-like protein with peptidoglycan-binding domain
MFKMHHIATAVALASAAALPACSMFGGGSGSQVSNGYASASPNDSSASSGSTAPQSTELTPGMIRQVQQTLQQNGTYHGNVDGVWGPATQSAVRDYQQQHNLNATGQLNQETLASMNLGGSTQQGNAQPPDQTQQSSNAQQPSSNYNPPPPSNTNPSNTNSPHSP